MTFELRRAGAQDAVGLAALCGQLGYASSPAQVQARLEGLWERLDHAVWVAEDGEGRVRAWIHVSLERGVESDPFAEIRGLVVDEGARGLGLGGRLVGAASGWAREQGVGRLRVRCNILREDTLVIYERMGFHRAKTQAVFDLTP